MLSRSPASGPARRPPPRRDGGGSGSGSGGGGEGGGSADADVSPPISILSTPTSSSFSSYLPSSAPTPYNTYFGDDAYDVSSPSSLRFAGDASNISSTAQEVMYDVGGDLGDGVSLGPSVSPTSSRRHPSIYSSRASSHLLPFSTTSSTESSIPVSHRPIPAPPQAVRSGTFAPSLFGGESTHTESMGPLQGDSNTAPDVHSKRLSGRGFRGRRPPKQIDRDTLRLQQLGYDAVLGRDYTFWSSLCISWINIGALQGSIFAVPGTYSYGGPHMILVAWPISGVLAFALTLTMSELASAYPVAGAMASWAWKCARGGVGGERYWGWLMGGIVLGGHVGNLVLVAWEAVDVIAGTMNLAFDYQAEAWQSVLFFLAIVAVVGTIGSTAWGRSPKYWLAAGAFSFATWLALCIVLLATGVRNRNYSPAISPDFYNETGWSSRAYVYFLGWQYCTIASGADASAHMSEETQNPSRNVPNAMTLSVVLTYITAYISIILLLISISPSDADMLSTHDFPVGYILQKAISNSGALAMCSLLIIVFCLQLQAQLQAASRFVFALARDRALPFSDSIQRTNSSKQPYIANWLVVALWAPFACLLIGSASSLYSVLAVAASTLSILGYMIPVALYLVSRKDLQLEGRTSWSLRRWSRPVGLVGVLFALTVVIVQTLPGHNPVTVQNMSWSPVVIVGTIVISIITWKCYGVNHYSGPIRALTKWETGVEIDLESTLQASTARANDAEQRSETKLAVTPHHPDTQHTVTIASARTVETVTSPGEWAAASFTTNGSGSSQVSSARSGGSGGTGSWRGSGLGTPGSDATVTRDSRSRAAAMGSVAEEHEGDGDGVSVSGADASMDVDTGWHGHNGGAFR